MGISEDGNVKILDLGLAKAEAAAPKKALKRRVVKRGQPHVSLYLVQSHGGKPRQVFVPKPWEDRIRAAVEDYRQMQQLMEELSEMEWRRLMERKE